MTMTRRQAVKSAAAFGAVLAWPSALLKGAAAGAVAAAPATERRDLYPQGVASGDPYPDSVILWTRRPPSPESRASRLAVEVAEDAAFARVVADGGPLAYRIAHRVERWSPGSPSDAGPRLERTRVEGELPLSV